MVQAKILRRTRAQWPGRNETRNRILRAGTFAEGRRGIPRKRGTGGGATMGGDAHRSPPPAAFCLLCRRGQRRSPRRAKPCEAARPTDVTAHGGAGGHMGPPLQRLRRITAGRENGRGKPLPYKVPGKYTPAENWRAGLGPAPTAIPELVRQLKSFSSRKINRISNVPKRAIWQRGNYEHILRNQQDFDKAAVYIAENPARRLEREEFE